MKRTVRQAVLLLALLTPTALAFVNPRIAVPLATSNNRKCCNTSSQQQQLQRLPSLSATASPSSDAAAAPATPTILARKRVGAMCAFLTAWANVALFTTYQTFATMMTGNSLWFARSLVDRQFGMVGYYASVIFSYCLGLAIHQKQPKTRVASLIFLLFAASQFIPLKVVAVSMLAMGFGIINSLGQDVTGTLTFVLTGHMTKVTHNLLDRSGSSQMNLTVIGGFFAGAVWSFLVKPLMTYKNQFLLMGTLYSTLFLWHDKINKADMCVVDDDGSVCEDDGDYIVDDKGFMTKKRRW